MWKAYQKDKKDADQNAKVSAGIGVVTAGVALHKKQDLNTVGAALTAVGTIASLAPPPAGPIIGTTLTVVGSFLPMFASKKPKPASEELKMLKGIRIQMDTVIGNQD